MPDVEQARVLATGDHGHLLGRMVDCDDEDSETDNYGRRNACPLPSDVPDPRAARGSAY